jgi:uncharacterized membrane protein YfcA
MFDVWVTIAGLLVGFVVGLTGMGGGALMTPILVLLFGIEPLAAVSSDLVASLFMKPVGSAVHLKSGTVHRGLVKWLVVGSVPAAFVGVLLLKLFGGGDQVQGFVKSALGVALLVVSSALILKTLVRRREGGDSLAPAPPELELRRLATMIVGVIGGVVVGMTSVGSGSLIILMLLVLYPRLRLSELVGTDLVQAVPLVAAASLAHVLFGDFRLSLTLTILLGAIPGVYLGARVSSRAPDHWIRPALVVVLTASGLKLLGASNAVLAIVSVVLIGAGVFAALTSARELKNRARETSSEPLTTA